MKKGKGWAIASAIGGILSVVSGIISMISDNKANDYYNQQLMEELDERYVKKED